MRNIKPHAQSSVNDVPARSTRKTRQTIDASEARKTVISHRARRPVRERYAALMSFVAFARGEDAELPGIPLRYTKPTMLAGGQLAAPLLSPEIRVWAAKFLRQIAGATTESVASDGLPPMRQFTLPAPPAPRVTMIGSRLVVSPAHNALNDFVEALARTLEQAEDLSRLKVCPICDSLFLALNRQSHACTPRCSNVLRQRKFWARAKAEHEEQVLAVHYRENANRNRIRRQEKKRLRLTGRLRPAK